MTLYNVHIYREMRLFFPGIQAGTPDEAAKIAADKQTADADYTEDCDGESLAALIDVQGDDDFSQSVTIDFEHEQLRKAAPELLAALKGCLFVLDGNEDGDGPSKQTAIKDARAAIAKAPTIHQPTIERRMP
jgi:hypothetical protein